MFIMSLRRQVVYLTLCLALLFAILEPQSSRGLVFGWALGFWLAHIGCGLLLAVVAARVLTRCSALHTWPAWLQLLLAGLFGSLAFAPVALGLGAMFPSTSDTMMSDDWLDVWELAGGWQALVAEWLQLLPSYLCAWMLINAVPLVQMAAPNLVPAQAQPVLDSDTRAVNPPDASTDWLNQLPIAIGRSLLRIEADLHYLKVFTENGRVMLLGNLSAATEQLGERGIRVHRSHWVAIDQVKRVHRTSKGWCCELRDGSKIPVSRRRVREVHDRLGRDFVTN
jgi:hypothetical protein